MAVVFLAVFIGLNMRKIGPRLFSFGSSPALSLPFDLWGRPLPLKIAQVMSNEKIDASNAAFTAKKKTEKDWLVIRQFAKELDASTAAARCYELPLTHQTYRLIEGRDWGEKGFPCGSVLINFAVLDALVGIIPLALILFLQIPRRKEPELVK